MAAEGVYHTAQNGAMMTDYIKVKIHKTQWNSKGRLCGDKGETIISIKTKGTKLAQRE